MRVPQYGPQQANIQPAGLTSMNQRSNAQVAAFGVQPRNDSAVGQSISGLGIAMQELAERARKVRAEEQLVEYQRERNGVLMDPKDGYFQKTGKAAYDNQQAVMEDLRERRRQRADSIDDPVAREMFTKATDSLLMSDEQQVMEYSARQFSAWEKAVSQQRIEMSMVDAMREWRNPEQVALHFELGRQSIIDANQDMGLEYINGAVDDYAGKFYRGVVEAAISSSVIEGEAMMKEFDGFLDPVDEINLREKIKSRRQQEETQETAELAVTKARSLVMDYRNYPDARKVIFDEIAKIKDPKLLDMTMTEAMQMLNQYETGVAEQQQAVYDQLSKAMLDPQRKMTTVEMRRDYPAEWSTLSGAQQAALMKAEETGPVQTDLRVWTQLTMAPDSEVKSLTQEQLLELQTVLSPTDYKQLVDRVRDLTVTGGNETRIGWTKNAQASKIMVGIFGDSAGKVDPQQEAAFYGLLNSEYNMKREELGRELTYSETDELYNRLASKYVVENRIFGVHYSDSEYDLEDVPPELVNSIAEILRAGGAEVSGETIAHFYRNNKDRLKP